MRILVLITLLLSILVVTLALAGQPAARMILDPLALDGTLEALTPAVYDLFRLPVLAVGLGGLVLAVWVWLRPAHGRAAWIAFWCSFSRLAAAMKALLGERWEWVAILAITALAVVVRIPFFERPFGHDEAYTYVVFARRSLWGLLSDYHLPNNHILHTLLVHISTGLLGNAPWAVRLPAMAAGVLCVPAAYTLGRIWHNRNAALLAAMLIAVTPLLITTSTDARGYTLLTLFSLLSWSLGSHLLEHPNPAGWALLVLFGALGFFTIPVMLYPLGCLYAWLFLSALFKPKTLRSYGSPVRFVLILFATGTLTSLVTFFLYTPAMLVSGAPALIANPFVAPLPWVDFPTSLAKRLHETWIEWQFDVPQFLTTMMVVGVVLETTMKMKCNHSKLPFLSGVLVWMIPVLLIQRPNAWRKIWIWLLALLLVLASIGWVALLEKFRKLHWLPRKAVDMIVITVLVCLAIISLPYAVQKGNHLAIPWSSELTADYLAEKLAPGKIVAIDPWHAPPIWYYLLRAGQPDTIFNQIHLRQEYAGVYVVTAADEPDSDLDSVLARAGPQSNPPDSQQCILLKEIPPYRIYYCPSP